MAVYRFMYIYIARLPALFTDGHNGTNQLFSTQMELFSSRLARSLLIDSSDISAMLHQ